MSMQIDITTAILALRPDARVRVDYLEAGPEVTWIETPEGGIPTANEIAAKRAELQAAADAREALLAAGWTPPGKDWALALGEHDQDLLAKYGQVLRDAKEQGLMTDASPAKLKDKDGVTHTMTVGECLAILTGYGLFVVELYWAQQN